MLGPELRHGPDDTDAAVLRQGAGDDLHGLADGHVRTLLDALHLYAGPAKTDRHGHLGGTATGQELGLVHDVPDDLHGVLEVALDLVEDVLGPTAEEDGAGLGILALLEEGEPLLPDLAHLEQAALGAEVGLLDLVGPADDGGAGGAGHPVVVRLAEAAEGRDAGLGEVVLGQVGHALLGHDDVGLECWCWMVVKRK